MGQLKLKVKELEAVSAEMELDLRMMLKQKQDFGVKTNPAPTDSTAAPTAAAAAATSAAKSSTADLTSTAPPTVEALQAKIVALEEWAAESARAKSEAMGRVMELQDALALKSRGMNPTVSCNPASPNAPSAPSSLSSYPTLFNQDSQKMERLILRRENMKFIVPAGSTHSLPISITLPKGGAENIDDCVVVLRWEFDVYGGKDVRFSIKGGAPTDTGPPTALLKERLVERGSGGEINLTSWRDVCLVFANPFWQSYGVMPRTVRVKYVQAFIVSVDLQPDREEC